MKRFKISALVLFPKKCAGALFFLFLICFLCPDAFSISKAMYNFIYQVKILNEDEFVPYCVKNYVRNLSEEDKIAQLFLLNLEGDTQFSDRTEHNDEIAPGGYLLFSYNIGTSSSQIRNFDKSVCNYYAKRGKIPPYLSIDHEGGYVNRLKQIFGWFPSEQGMAENYSVEQSYSMYLEQGERLKNLGIHVNLAPIVEEKTEQNAAFLDDRSFGNLDAVVQYGTQCVNAYLDSGIAPVLKHFPGNTNDDPHLGLPKLNCDKNEFEKMILPFEKILSQSRLYSQPSGIILSHAMVSALFGDVPACFSKDIVTGILKQRYGYRGLIISDDIYMAALEKNGYPPELSAKLCVLAGIDVIMISTKRFTSILEYLKNEQQKDAILHDRITESAEKIVANKIAMGLMKKESHECIYASAFDRLGFPRMKCYELSIAEQL